MLPKDPPTIEFSCFSAAAAARRTLACSTAAADPLGLAVTESIRLLKASSMAGTVVVVSKAGSAGAVVDSSKSPPMPGGSVADARASASLASFFRAACCSFENFVS